jgi:WD40 repeat protein
MISGSSDNSIRVWDAQSYTCIHTLKGHTNSVYDFKCHVILYIYRYTSAFYLLQESIYLQDQVIKL